MTYNPTYDRTDWRAVSTRTLIEAARDSGHELAIALGERLEDLEDADDERAEFMVELREARRVIDALRYEISTYEFGPDED